RIDDPGDPWTFVRSKLDWTERRRNAELVQLHRDLLRLRREDPVIRAQRPRAVDGAVVNDQTFLLRYFGNAGDDRLLVVNLGARFHADPLAEPLSAAPAGRRWKTICSTESPKYGGWGIADVDTADDGWWIPAECAVLLSSVNDAPAH